MNWQVCRCKRRALVGWAADLIQSPFPPRPTRLGGPLSFGFLRLCGWATCAVQYPLFLSGDWAMDLCLGIAAVWWFISRLSSSLACPTGLWGWPGSGPASAADGAPWVIGPAACL